MSEQNEHSLGKEMEVLLLEQQDEKQTIAGLRAEVEEWRKRHDVACQTITLMQQAREQRADYQELSQLSMYLAQGSGDGIVTAEKYGERIRSGIAHIIDVEKERLKAESDALKRERDELFRWRIEAQDELIKCGYTIGKLHEAEEVLAAQLQQAREERDASEAKRKETAKDFETAFRTVRQENDRLQSELSAALAELAEARKQVGWWNCQCHGQTEAQCQCGSATAFVTYRDQAAMAIAREKQTEKSLGDALKGQNDLRAQLSAANDQVQSLRRALEAGKTCICGAFRLADAALASEPASTSGLDVVRVLRGWLAGAGCPAGNGYKPIPVPKELSQLSFNHMGILADYFEGLPASTSGVRSDSERLDWLDKNCRHERVGGWDGHIDEPSYWRNPSVQWRISDGEECGTYDMPEKLKQLTIRQVIDAAMSQRTGA